MGVARSESRSRLLTIASKARECAFSICALANMAERNLPVVHPRAARCPTRSAETDLNMIYDACDDACLIIWLRPRYIGHRNGGF